MRQPYWRCLSRHKSHRTTQTSKTVAFLLASASRSVFTGGRTLRRAVSVSRQNAMSFRLGICQHPSAGRARKLSVWSRPAPPPTSVRRSGLGWRSRSQMSAIVRTISPVLASTISTDQVSCQDLVETCQRPESAAHSYERARPSCARISVGVLPVHRLNACVKALTS